MRTNLNRVFIIAVNSGRCNGQWHGRLHDCRIDESVELRAHQNREANQIEPHECSHACTERSVDNGIVSVASEVPAEA